MNNDKHVDIVGENGKIWTWTSKDWAFTPGRSAVENCDDCHIISADINFDGYNDLLIQRPDGAKDVVECLIFQKDAYEADKSVFFKSYGTVATVMKGHQISIFDNNSDMQIDLIGIDTDGKLAVWENTWSEEDCIFKKTIFEEFSNRAIVTPFSPLSVDIDGDCNADFVILTCDGSTGVVAMENCSHPIIEFYINDGGKFKREAKKDYKAPRGIGRITVGDIDRDGNTDIVYPVCYPHATCSEVNHIEILYNYQIEMCHTFWFFSRNCRKQTNLCTREVWNLGIVIDRIDLGKDRYIVSDSSLPRTVRISDWNMDGYPDFVIAVAYRSKPGVSMVEIWNNVDCNDKLCGQSYTSRNRGFERQTSGMEEVEKLTHVKAAFFLDLDESGTLDMIVVSSTEDGSTKSVVNAFFNNFHPDAFFFKNMGLNGVTTNGGYGAIVPGFTFKFNIPINDLAGGKIPRVCSQATSSNYLSLETPYCFFGLGRENGYIENFFMGAPVTDKANTKYVKHEPGIIPNSQLICIPKPITSPSSWELQLFVTPTAHSIWVGVAVVVMLVLIGIPILICWILEKHSDRKSKKMNQTMRAFL